jgi:hypothetical protein
MDKGIVDHDAVIEKNSGFVDKKAFFLDIGGFSKENSPLPSSELTHTTAHLLNWLERCDPELALFFKKERLAFF